MNRAQTEIRAERSSVAEVALRELQDRIEASCLESSYVGMVCDLCMGQVSLEEAFREIHQKAMEQLLGLLDVRVLEDDGAMEACLDRIAKESERVAWAALEQGTEALREGIARLENGELVSGNEYVN